MRKILFILCVLFSICAHSQTNFFINGSTVNNLTHAAGALQGDKGIVVQSMDTSAVPYKIIGILTREPGNGITYQYNGSYWVPFATGFITTPNLQTVLSAGNTASTDIKLLNPIGTYNTYGGRKLSGIYDSINFTSANDINFYTGSSGNINLNAYAVYVNGGGGFHGSAGGIYSPYSTGYVFDAGVGVTYLNATYPGSGSSFFQTLQAKTGTVADLSDITSAIGNYVTKNTVDTIVSPKYIFPVLDFASTPNITKYGVTITPTILNNTTGDVAVALQVNGAENVSTNLTVGTATSSPIVQASTRIIANNYVPYGSGVLLSNGALVGGTGYTNGTYTSQTLTSSTGTLNGVAITVSGNAVTNITYGSNSTGFKIGDTIRWPAGTGTGFYTIAKNITAGFYFDSIGTTTPFVRFVDNSKHVLINYGNAADTGIYNLDVNGTARINNTLNLSNILTGTAANGLYLDASGNVIKGSTPVTGSYINNVSTTGVQQSPGAIAISGGIMAGGTYANPQFFYDSANTRLAISTTGSTPVNYGIITVVDSNTSTIPIPPLIALQHKDVTGRATINFLSNTNVLHGTLGYSNASSAYFANKVFLSLAGDTLGFFQNNVEKTRMTPAGFWGINTTNPSTLLNVSETSTSTTRGITNDQINNGPNGARISFRKSRSGTVITTGDTLMRIIAQGYDGTSYTDAAGITAASIGTVATGKVGGKFTISTVNPTTGTIADGLTVDSSQYTYVNRLGIGTSLTTQSAITIDSLQATGGIKLFATNDKTTNSSLGQIYYNGTQFNIASFATGTSTVKDLLVSAGASQMTLSSGGVINSALEIRRNSSAIQNIASITSSGLTSSSGFQNAFRVVPTFSQTSTAGNRGIWISPFYNTVGSGKQWLIDAGTNTAADATGTHTQQWGVDNVGHEFSPATITAIGTTGNQTINKPNGTINIASTGTSVVLTNNLITTSSMIFCTIQTNDATAKSVQAVPGSGTCTIYLNAAATGTVAIAFWVKN